MKLAVLSVLLQLSDNMVEYLFSYPTTALLTSEL